MVYADFNATTPLGDAALEAIRQGFECWGNPSSTHKAGRDALALIQNARSRVATATGRQPENVIFTSGGSEAGALALQGAFWETTERPFRLLSSRLEHSSIRDCIKRLGELGAEVRYVKTLPSGALDEADFERTLQEFKPHLVSLMTANNETGVVYPIPKLATLAKQQGALFHTDAVQAFGKLDPAHWADCPLVSISAHKIHGPKGVGALLADLSVKLRPTHFGGAQEIKRRGGTENVLGILGFGGACRELPEQSQWDQVRQWRDGFEAALRAEFPELRIQGEDCPRLPNTSNVRIPGVSAEVMLSALDLDGVCVSAGSACSSGSLTPSHVLVEMGLTPDEARECLRVSFGKTTRPEEVDTVRTLVIKHGKRILSRRK